MLAIWIATISLITCLVTASPEAQEFENCKIKSHQRKFDNLPGRGWDNLRNEPMGQVLNLNFSKCQFSQDNIYLIPDFVSLTPTKMSEVILNADTFEHFTNYTSSTAQSINLEAHGGYGAVSVSGSFSVEKEEVKSDQVQTRSSITRVQLRYNTFKAIAEPDAQLHPTFRNRIIDIAGLVIENKDFFYPQYLADMVVRDYGTHVIHTMDVGAVLSKTDYIDSEYVKHMKGGSTAISVAASASFGNMFGISAKYSNRVSKSQVNEYNKNCKKSRIETRGGTLYGANFSLDDWRRSVSDNMIPIDRNGDPIYFAVNSKSLPDLDGDVVDEVQNLLMDAVKRYYTANSRIGCLDINAKNFNPDANVDGRNCKPLKVSFTFGGVFQTCSGPGDPCNKARQINHITGDYSCPPKYQAVLLYSGIQECWTLWYGKRECSHYYLYWCSPIDALTTNPGYRFGGFISPDMKTCPMEYFPVKVGLRSKMCVSLSNNPFDSYAIKFGGLYSCKVGNALAVKGDKGNSWQDWPKACADGYVSRLVTLEQGCQISYCSETKNFSHKSRPLIKRPPFISLNYNPNSTEVDEFTTSDGKVFVKTNLGNWESDGKGRKERKWFIWRGIGAFCFVCLLATVALIIQGIRYKKKLTEMKRQEFLINPTLVNYGTITENKESA